MESSSSCSHLHPATPHEQVLVARMKEHFFGVDTPPEVRALADRAVVASDPDRTLLRFLRARQGHFEKACKMFDACIRWRESSGVNNILNEGMLDPAKLRVIREAMPHSFHGVDKAGRPLFVQHSGRINLKLLEKEKVSLTDTVRFHLQLMEYQNVLFEQGKARTGVLVDTITVVHDLRGLGLSQLKPLAYQTLKAMADIDQKHYPETLGSMFMVNAPWTFWAAWKVISPWVNKRTLEKIHILKEGPEQTRELLTHIDPAHLPVSLGGACNCANGCLCDAVNDFATGAMKEMQEFFEARQQPQQQPQATERRSEYVSEQPQPLSSSKTPSTDVGATTKTPLIGEGGAQPTATVEP
eukprot:GILJ01006588.1.p1 GENE.GILJ01006588.1~~GILJ01006588.1.p1  ORF type:complete len:355 (-),score=29.84 GILJ01006588.1:113-1177(-)